MRRARLSLCFYLVAPAMFWGRAPRRTLSRLSLPNLDDAYYRALLLNRHQWRYSFRYGGNLVGLRLVLFCCSLIASRPSCTVAPSRLHGAANNGGFGGETEVCMQGRFRYGKAYPGACNRGWSFRRRSFSRVDASSSQTRRRSYNDGAIEIEGDRGHSQRLARGGAFQLCLAVGADQEAEKRSSPHER